MFFNIAYVPSFCLTRHIDITGVFRILQRGCMAQMTQW